MKFYIVDAFAENLFAGNPAGVVILDESFPDDATCIKTACELRYSETAFIQKLDDNNFKIRYFTPTAEVDLCGHATIASFYVLFKEGIICDGTYTNHTLAGALKVTVKDGFIMMDMATPSIISTIDEQSQLIKLYNIMGLEYSSVSHGVKNLPVMIISTGLPDIIMPVKDKAELAKISPDFPALARLSEDYGVTGVHAFTLTTTMTSIAACTRNFAPLYDIDEEAATGTASGALIYYMYKNNLIDENSKISFIQGESLGRVSKISASLLSSNEIQVGGTARILAKGFIFI